MSHQGRDTRYFSEPSKSDDGGPKSITSVYRRFINEQGKFVDVRVRDDAGALVIIMRDDRSCMENIITYREAAELYYALGEALNGSSLGRGIGETPKEVPNPPE